MPINTSLLIAAPMLQDYLVDKDTGTPLANGIVTMYKDTARTQLKNWYYQTGIPGAYTYIALDNPMHISSVGTIQDPNGNDVIPFYYPYDENDENVSQPYYVTVYSVDETGAPAILQFTRENFPFVAPAGTPTTTTPTLRNYIINNVFWRNCGALSLTNETNKIVVPSQHDGYTFDHSDIRFVKNIIGANDSISFPECPTLPNAITPEYCLEFQCAGTQVGETVKCFQIPISLHVKTLQNVPFSFRFWGESLNGTKDINVSIYQYLGAGVVSPDPIPLGVATLQPGGMRVFPFTGTFPDASTLILGNGQDDALFIRLELPLSSDGVCHFQIAKPQLFLSNTLPDNDFDTYEQASAVFGDARTGDIRTGFSAFGSPFGYISMNDTTIGNVASAATGYASPFSWPLYYLLYTNVIDTYAPVSGGRTGSAINDFNANKTLGLTKTLGRSIASLGRPSGANPLSPTTWALGQETGTENTLLTSSVLPALLTAGAGTQIVQGGAGNTVINDTGSTGGTGRIANSEGGHPLTLMNPTTHVNVFIKL